MCIDTQTTWMIVYMYSCCYLESCYIRVKRREGRELISYYYYDFMIIVAFDGDDYDDDDDDDKMMIKYC